LGGVSTVRGSGWVVDQHAQFLLILISIARPIRLYVGHMPVTSFFVVGRPIAIRRWPPSGATDRPITLGDLEPVR